MDSEDMTFGAELVDGGNACFRVWAPGKKEVVLRLGDGRKVPMEREERGFWKCSAALKDTMRYGYEIDGEGVFPDPASRCQPDGVHGLSKIVDTAGWMGSDDGWKGIELSDYVIMEIHVGTFTRNGTFSAVEEKLDYLADLGITALELMPVAQFYGSRNWGYDGVYIYAPQNSYGSPYELRHLVDAAHSRKMAVVLDVVYNHIGPVGNCLSKYGPFFSDRYRTPWGTGLNYDGPYCDPVREFVLSNAVYWLEQYRFDALRLDAIHGILDSSPKHLLREMAERVDALSSKTGRRLHLIAESDLNDPKVVRGRDSCGYGISAQWNDDFHHSIHTVLTGELGGYYEDYGSADYILKAMKDGFVYDGAYSKHLARRRGAPFAGMPREKLIVFSQNHDQIGNRAQGDRLSVLVPPEKMRFAAGAVLLSPFTPMLFMGEEYAEKAPFLFFIDTDDRNFANTVYEGRKKEFELFHWQDTPKPNSLETFERTKLRWNTADEESGRILRLYRDLLALRKRYIPTLRNDFKCSKHDGIMLLEYGGKMRARFNLSGTNARLEHEAHWNIELNSEWKEYGGSCGRTDSELRPFSFAVAVH